MGLRSVHAGDPRDTAYDNDGVRVESVFTCALCGAEGRALYDGLRDQMFEAPGHWSLQCCSRCGLVWLHPRPLTTDIAKLYRQYHTHTVPPDRTGPRRWRDRAKQRVLAKAFGYGDGARFLGGRIVDRVLSSIEPLRELVGATLMWLHAAQRGRLLDVGCGSGAFLKWMRELGWQVHGVEPDPAAARVAKEECGLDVTCGTLEDAALPTHRFDAVTLNHVVEHLPDPVATLRECGRVLKPRGRLVITTPNVESLGRRWFRTAWRGLEVPRHLQLYSVETLAECARQAGLRVEVVRSSANSARWMHAASRLLKRDGVLPGGTVPPHLPPAIRLPGLLFWGLEWLQGRFSPVGEEVVLIAGVGR